MDSLHVQVMEKTKKYLTSVGDSISDVANMKGRNSARNVQRLRQRLWQVQHSSCWGNIYVLTSDQLAAAS